MFFPVEGINNYFLFQRFSHFAKSGGESFMMGQVDTNVPDSDRIRIVVCHGLMFLWPPTRIEIQFACVCIY